MSSTTAAQAASFLNSNSTSNIRDTNPKSTDEQVIASLGNSSSGQTDTVDIALDGVYKSLTVLGDEIISKLDELLAEELPDGIRSLKPEEQTSEATAQRIADGVTAFLPIYAQQNPNLQGEELVDKFLEEVRGGIQEGYDDAIKVLEGLGAFEFDGVRDGIEQTMNLVDEKLNAFKENFLASLQPPKEEEPAEEKSEPTSKEATPAAVELEQRLAVNA